MKIGREEGVERRHVEALQEETGRRTRAWKKRRLKAMMFWLCAKVK
jgi:hypothetical protein